MPARDLAKRAGYSSATISLWERGVNLCPRDARKNICEAMGFELGVLENLAKGPGALERAALNIADFNEPDELLTRFELAKLSGVNARAIQSWVNSGLLTSVLDGRRRYYTKDAIDVARRLKENRFERQGATYKKTLEKKRCSTL